MPAEERLKVHEQSSILVESKTAPIVQIVDSKNLRRGLLLTIQLAELDQSLVMDLNMTDEVITRGVAIDTNGLSKLLGVEPGAEIKLYQKLPAFVVKVNQTEVALDKDVAQEIFVRPSNGK